MDDFHRELVEKTIKNLIIKRNSYYCDTSNIKILYILKDKGNRGLYVMYNNETKTWVDKDEYGRKRCAFYYKKEYLSWDSIISNINLDALFFMRGGFINPRREFSKLIRKKKLFRLEIIKEF